MVLFLRAYMTLLHALMNHKMLFCIKIVCLAFLKWLREMFSSHIRVHIFDCTTNVGENGCWLLRFHKVDSKVLSSALVCFGPWLSDDRTFRNYFSSFSNSIYLLFRVRAAIDKL